MPWTVIGVDSTGGAAISRLAMRPEMVAWAVSFWSWSPRSMASLGFIRILWKLSVMVRRSARGTTTLAYEEAVGGLDPPHAQDSHHSDDGRYQ